MTVEFDDLVDELVERGNLGETKEICEPNIMEPLTLEAWMVKRTMIAWCLIYKTLEESLKKE